MKKSSSTDSLNTVIQTPVMEKMDTEIYDSEEDSVFEEGDSLAIQADEAMESGSDSEDSDILDAELVSEDEIGEKCNNR